MEGAQPIALLPVPPVPDGLGQGDLVLDKGGVGAQGLEVLPVLGAFDGAAVRHQVLVHHLVEVRVRLFEKPQVGGHGGLSRLLLLGEVEGKAAGHVVGPAAGEGGQHPFFLCHGEQLLSCFLL